MGAVDRPQIWLGDTSAGAAHSGGIQNDPNLPPPFFAPPGPASASGAQPKREAIRAGAPRDAERSPSGTQGRGGHSRTGPGEPCTEAAIYLDGVTVSFTPLLLPLGVGSAAALALLAAVIIIGLRFPHYISGRQYEEELALARRVQHDLFPTEGIPTGNVEFAARFIPSRQVGGDLYDIFETDDGGVAMVLEAGISGKGFPQRCLWGSGAGSGFGLRAMPGCQSATNMLRGG